MAKVRGGGGGVEGAKIAKVRRSKETDTHIQRNKKRLTRHSDGKKVINRTRDRDQHKTIRCGGDRGGRGENDQSERGS